MKKILITGFMLLFIALSLKAQWNIIDNWGTAPVNRIKKGSDGLLYAAGDAGLFRSADFGRHWDAIPTPVKTSFRQLALKDNMIYTVGLSGYNRLWESKNAGASWQEIAMPPNVNLDENFVQSFEIAGPYLFVVANTGILRRNLAGGAWENIPGALPGAVNDLFVAEEVIWAAQHTDSVYQSNDFGQTWISRPIGTWFVPYRLAVNGQTVLGIYKKDYLISSVALSQDGGVQWQIVPTPEIFDNIDFGAGRFFARAVSGNIWSSIDGSNWQAFYPTSSPNSWSAMTEQNGQWIMPSAGGALRSDDQGASWAYYNSWKDNNHPGKVSIRSEVMMAENKHFSIDEGWSWVLPTYPVGLFSTLWKYNGQYYAQTDGGEGLFQANSNFSTWTRVLPPDSLQHSSAAGVAQMGNTLFATSSRTTEVGYVFRSDDGGFHWTLVYDDPEDFAILRTHGDSMLIGVSDYYGNKKFVKSVDGGVSWTTFANGYLDGSSSFQMISANGYLYTLRKIVNQRYRIIRSADAGETWVDISQQLIPPAQQSTYGIYDYTVQDSLVFVYTDHYQGNEDRIFVSVSGTEAWSDVTGGLDPNTVDITSLRVTKQHLYFTNILDGTLWQRPISEIVRNPVFGRVWYDLNNNGIQDPTEGAYPNIVLETKPGNRLAMCNSMGKFTLFDGITGDTLRPVLPSPFLAADPAFAVIDQNATPLSFRIYWNPPITDLRVTATPLSDFLSGLPVTTVFSLNNVGADTLSGKLQVILDQNLELVSTAPDSSSYNGTNLLTWQFDDLKPLEQRNFLALLRVKLLLPSTPIAIIAQAPIVDDITPKNNIDTLLRIVLGSFDPNDKQVNRTRIHAAEVSEKPELTYTIRFQNTGNYPAFKVRLLDTLSSWVEVSRLKVLAASHAWSAEIHENNILEFVFEHINLPDSTADKEGSQGFITFSVPLKGLIPPDSAFVNQAHIYFDLNAPITTNQAITRIEKTVVNTVDLAGQLAPLKVSPNPAAQFIQISLPDQNLVNGYLRIANSAGQMVVQQSFETGPIQVNVWALPAGTYYVWITAEDKTYRASFIRL